MFVDKRVGGTENSRKVNRLHGMAVPPYLSLFCVFSWIEPGMAAVK